MGGLHKLVGALPPGTRVELNMTGNLANVPLLCVRNYGTILRSNLPVPYIYEVAVDDVDPGQSGMRNRYIYAWWEVSRAEP